MEIKISVESTTLISFTNKKIYLHYSGYCKSSILPKSPASIPLKRRCIVQVNCHKVHTLNTHSGFCCCVYRFSYNFHSNSQKKSIPRISYSPLDSRHELARKPHQNYYSRVSPIRKKIIRLYCIFSFGIPDS